MCCVALINWTLLLFIHLETYFDFICIIIIIIDDMGYLSKKTHKIF